ncbi:MAG: SPASM domain-containing protein [Rhodospirillales bacterium]|nr:SPASM domain-containing protein [Rhodospirillales bacterium]
MIRQAKNPAESPTGWVINSRELTVENTTHCGADCVMCPRDDYQFKWSHMDNALFRSVIDQSVSLGVTSLDLCGFGDPFLDPKYAEKLEYVKTAYPSVITYTSTTGHALQGKNFDLACKYLDTIRISNYGFSKKSYEAVHGGGLKFEQVQKNIHRLLALPKTERPYVMVSFLILPENEHETEQWREYWEPLADEIAIWRPHNYGGDESTEKVAFRSSARQEKDKQHTCGRPFKGNPFVRTNGDVSVCCFDYNHQLVVGNLNEKPLIDILSSDKMKYVREVHNSLSFDSCDLPCKGCDQTYDRGDALVYASNKNRRVDQPNNHPDHLVHLVAE